MNISCYIGTGYSVPHEDIHWVLPLPHTRTLMGNNSQTLKKTCGPYVSNNMRALCTKMIRGPYVPNEMSCATKQMNVSISSKAGMEYSAPLEDIRLVLSLPHRNITSLCGARNSYVARHVYLYSFGLVATAKECLVSRRISRATQGRTIPCHVEIFIWPCRCPIQAHHCGRNSQKSTVKLFCIVI